MFRPVLRRCAAAAQQTVVVEEGFAVHNLTRSTPPPRLSLFSHSTDEPLSRPSLKLAGEPAEMKVRRGSPWLLSKDVIVENNVRSPCLVNVIAPTSSRSEKREMGVAIYNKNSRIIARMLDTDPYVKIDHRWFIEKIQRALHQRDMMFSQPYYRLIHAESDGIPGVNIDRYDDHIVLIINCNGMGNGTMLRPLMKAIEDTLSPSVIIFRHDSSLITKENAQPEIYKGVYDGPIEMLENNVTHLVDLTKGANTGWYFDQRANRAKLSSLARDRNVLDLYAGSGGFGLQCASAGARSVTFVDTNHEYLQLGQRSVDINGLTNMDMTWVQKDAIAYLDEVSNITFDMIIVDPPMLSKSHHGEQVYAAKRQYEKILTRSAKLLSKNGILFVSANSPFFTHEDLVDSARRSLSSAKREGRIISSSGADADFPTHLALADTSILKTITLCVD